MSARVLRRLVIAGCVVLCLFVLVPAVNAFGGEAEGGNGDGDAAKQLAQVALVILLGVMVALGMGGATALIRVILPGVAKATDASVRRLSTSRLLLFGVVPLVGSWLIAWGVGATGNAVLGGVYALLVGIPVFLAVVAGMLAALPHIGAHLLKDGNEAGMLKRCLVGGLVLGLSQITWILPPLGLLVGVLLLSWFTGIGAGSVVRPRETAVRAEESPV